MVRGVAVRARLGALLALVLLIVLVAAACGPGVVDPTSSEQKAADAEQATKKLQQAERQDLGCNNIVTSRDKRVTPPPEHMVLLVDAVAVAEPCWDKITFTFKPTGANAPPGYTIEYRDPPFVEGDEGQYTVETLGNAFLYITFAPASETDYTSGQPRQTYPGNLRLRLEDMHFTEIVRKIQDHPDGTQSWLIGLNEKRPFTVDAVANSKFGISQVSVYIMK
jgi:hypothetical protein